MMGKPITQIIQLGDLSIDVIQQDIKNIHLSVYPPDGHVHIAAPKNINTEALRAYAISKLGWIIKQQQKFKTQIREAPHEYLNRESHYLWGKRYLLATEEKKQKPCILLNPNHITLQIRPGATLTKKQSVLEEFYRQELKRAIPPLISTWEDRMAVNVKGFTVRKMKTKWGSCSPDRGTIRINLELAKKPRRLLEYVIVHEMTHFLEQTHNHRFIEYMNTFFPHWQFYREELNRLPLTRNNIAHSR